MKFLQLRNTMLISASAVLCCAILTSAFKINVMKKNIQIPIPTIQMPDISQLKNMLMQMMMSKGGSGGGGGGWGMSGGGGGGGVSVIFSSLCFYNCLFFEKS